MGGGFQQDFPDDYYLLDSNDFSWNLSEGIYTIYYKDTAVKSSVVGDISQLTEEDNTINMRLGDVNFDLYFASYRVFFQWINPTQTSGKFMDYAISVSPDGVTSYLAEDFKELDGQLDKNGYRYSRHANKLLFAKQRLRDSQELIFSDAPNVKTGSEGFGEVLFNEKTIS